MIGVYDRELFEAGYICYEDDHYMHCDRLFQKHLNLEKTLTVNVMYYGDIGNGDYEVELFDITNDGYILKKHMYDIKDFDIDRIEKELLG